MNEKLLQKLQIGRFQAGDVVRHYRKERLYRVLGARWRSETILVLNVKTGEEEIIHPRLLREVTEPLLVIAAHSVVAKSEL